jgi:hypothetical protein
MASFKSHPIFYSSLLLIGAVTAGEIWLTFSQRSQAAAIESEIAQKTQTLGGFAMQSPFPSKENYALVENDLEQADKTREEIRKTLSSNSEVAGKIASATVPATSTDAYFDIANYVERIRESAQKAGIVLSAENRLGFSAYASTGPDRELIPAVFLQRQYADYLLGVLIASQPREIVGLQRERPQSAEEKRLAAEAIAAGQPVSIPSDSSDTGDFFVIDPRTSARVAEFVETIPFRLTFVGTTTALRNLLNQLAKFDLPAVVRSVEVAPIATTERSTSAPARTGNATNPFALFGGGGGEGADPTTEAVKPLVEQTDSRFVVTVEFVSLVDKNAPEAAPEATNP